MTINVQTRELVRSALIDVNEALLNEGDTKSRVCLELAREALERAYHHLRRADAGQSGVKR